MVGRHRRIALRSCIPGRFAIEANNNAVVGVDNEGIRGACDSVPFVVHAVPLIVDVARVRPIILVSDTDQMVFAAFVFCRVLQIDQSPLVHLHRPKSYVADSKVFEGPANAPRRVQIVERVGNFIIWIWKPAPLLEVISSIV